MSGVVTKENLWDVVKNFGVIVAVKFLFSNEKTFLDFCVKNELI